MELPNTHSIYVHLRLYTLRNSNQIWIVARLVVQMVSYPLLYPHHIHAIHLVVRIFQLELTHLYLHLHKNITKAGTSIPLLLQEGPLGNKLSFPKLSKKTLLHLHLQRLKYYLFNTPQSTPDFIKIPKPIFSPELLQHPLKQHHLVELNQDM